MKEANQENILRFEHQHSCLPMGSDDPFSQYIFYTPDNDEPKVNDIFSNIHKIDWIHIYLTNPTTLSLYI